MITPQDYSYGFINTESIIKTASSFKMKDPFYHMTSNFQYNIMFFILPSSTVNNEPKAPCSFQTHGVMLVGVSTGCDRNWSYIALHRSCICSSFQRARWGQLSRDTLKCKIFFKCNQWRAVPSRPRDSLSAGDEGETLAQDCLSSALPSRSHSSPKSKGTAFRKSFVVINQMELSVLVGRVHQQPCWGAGSDHEQIQRFSNSSMAG